MTQLIDNVLVPIADEEDASQTAESLATWFQEEDAEQNTRITLLHVVEKGGGQIDKAPLPAATERGEKSLAVGRTLLENRGYHVETELRYGSDVVETIIGTARELDATALLFRPRAYSVLHRLLNGDTTGKLVRNSPCPAIVLPVDT